MTTQQLPARAPAEPATVPAHASYLPPIADILLALDVAGLDEILGLSAFADVDRAAVEVAVQELGRFAAEVIAPTDRPGDVVGSTLDPGTGRVRTPAPGTLRHSMEMLADAVTTLQPPTESMLGEVEAEPTDTGAGAVQGHPGRQRPLGVGVVPVWSA